MDDGKDRGGCKDRHVLPASSYQNPKNHAAKECFFNRWNGYRGRHDLAKRGPGNAVTQGVDAKNDEKSTAAEQGNRGKKNAREKITRRARIRRQLQILHGS